MRRIAALLLLLAAGCSTAPVADLLDAWTPGRLPPDAARYYGGVGNLPLPAAGAEAPPAAPVPPPVPGR
jgi:hypothetical protein